MKIQNLLVTISAVTLAAITINAGANNIVLSPRAAANQIVTVKSTAGPALTSEQSPAVRVALSPRAAANQIATVKGTGETVAASCTPLGSPKHIAAAGKSAKMSCCGLSLGECPTMAKMN